MNLVNGLKERFMAIPWVYDTIRPVVIGGFDFAAVARFCDLRPTDRVLDLGCGTAQLVPHLRFARYLGVDPDAGAIAKARALASGNVRFLHGEAWDEGCRELDPDVVLLIGVVHHVSDEDFRSIVRRVVARDGRPRIVTFDSTYFRGHPVNNLLSRLDRGRHVRWPSEYEELFRSCGLEILRREVLPTRLRYARYIGYHLAPGGELRR